MKKLTKLLIILLITIAPLSVFANGKQEVEAKDDQPIKLTWLILEFWNPTSVIEAYKAIEPNVEIEVEKVGFGDLLQQNQIRLSSKGGDPDIVSIDVPLVASYGVRNWLYPLDGIISSKDKKTWIDASVEAGTYKGKFLAAPQHTSTQVLYINYDLHESAGIEIPGPDDRWTWEQVQAAGKKISDGDVWGFTWEQDTAAYQLLPLVQSLGGKAIGKDGLSVDGIINSPEWIKALTYYGDSFNKYGISPKGDIPAADLFTSGKIAMFLGGPWNIRRFAGADMGFNWGVSRHPYFEGGDVVTPTGSWHFGVNAYSQYPEEAAKFVKFLTAGEGSRLWWSKDSYEFPAQVAFLESIMTESEFQDGPLAAMRTAADEAKVNPIPRPVTPAYLEYKQILGNVFDDIKNGSDPKTVLETAIPRIEFEMEKYKQ